MRVLLLVVGVFMALLQLCSLQWVTATAATSTKGDPHRDVHHSFTTTAAHQEWQVQETGAARALLQQENAEGNVENAKQDSRNITASASPSTTTQQQQHRACSIYMAPSSLKGLQGYGIFTTRDMKRLEPILQAPDGPSIVVTDYSVNDNQHHEPKHLRKYRRHWTRMWDNYWWGRGVGDHATYEGRHRIDFQPTFGALPNHHCLWNTILHNFPTIPYMDHLSLLSSSSDNTTTLAIGAGAYSYHAGREFRVKRALPAGSEIFLNYGHCDRTDVDHAPEWTKYSKMEQDYEQAAKLVLTLWNALYYYEPTGTVRDEYQHVVDTHTLESYTGRQLMDVPLVEGILYHSDILRQELAHPVRSMIPTTTGELFRVLHPFVTNTTNTVAKEIQGGNEHGDEQTHNEEDGHETAVVETDPRFQRLQGVKLMKLAEQLERIVATNPRTPQWIKDHGMCLEHLVPQQSTLPHAGQGGFAQHYIGKGEIVVPAPTLHILHRDVLKMSSSDDTPTSNKTQYQLLLNYCWGNPQTTLLVCPVTNAQLINHCSDRPGFPCPQQQSSSASSTTTTTTTTAAGPNAKIQWAKPNTWDPSTEQWLQMTIEEMMQQPLYQRGLSLEVIATRDIHPGEEVFMDYGVEWEQAWTRHVIEWNNNNNDKDSHQHHKTRQSVTQLNLDIDNGQEPLHYLVANDLRAPDNAGQDDYLMTTCMYEVTKQDTEDIYQQKNPNWRQDYTDQELLDKFSDLGEDFDYGGYFKHPETVYWPCTVLRQDSESGSNTFTYTVRIHGSPLEDELPPWHDNNVPRILTHYPLASIRYFPRMYDSDQHMVGAFRHSLGLPDDMIPEQWKVKDQSAPRDD